MNKEELYLRARDKWSLESQMRQTQEEAAELVVAINHYTRGLDCGVSELLEETADMEIMIEQMRLALKFSSYANSEIDRIKELKLARLEDMLKEDTDGKIT